MQHHANTHTKAREFGVEEHQSQANIEAFGISNFLTQTFKQIRALCFHRQIGNISQKLLSE